jgi:two-component system sensor histidine kinase PhoQ
MSANPDSAMKGSATPPSLLFRLTVSALLVVLLALGLIGLAVDRAFLNSEQTALRERLSGTVLTVLSGLEVRADGSMEWAGIPGESPLTRPQSGLYAGVVGTSEDWFSPSTLGAPTPSVEALPSRGSEDWLEPSSDRDLYLYRMALGWELSDGRIIDLTAWAAEDAERVQASMRRFRADLWRWLALAAVVLLIAQLVLLAQPLLVLRRVAAEVRSIETGDRERLAGRYPRELAPLTENLNALLATERANAERYSRAVGDLAHSLKTPLAVLQAQVSDSTPVPIGDLRETVAQMQVRIRTELDRAALSARRTMLAPVEVRPLAERLFRSLSKLYPEVSFDLDCREGVRAAVDPRDLIEVLGNLLENAAKYGNGKVRLRLMEDRAEGRRPGLRIEVDDNGPGVSAGRFEQLLQRGVRGDERAEGQGLGLAIVQRIAESYHGRIEAAPSQLGGVSVRVRLLPE